VVKPVPAYALQKIHSLSRHGHRVKRFILENGIKDFVLVISTERRLSEQHLIGQDSESPPVDGSGVTLFEQDLPKECVQKATRKGKGQVKLTSGAMNSGVPQKVLVVLPNHMSSLQRP